MGLTQYLKKAFQNKSKEDNKAQLIEYRKQPTSVRVDHPTRLDRARALGFKAKQGYFIVRQRVRRGGHEREHYRGGKRSKNNTSRLSLSMNYQWIAEIRVAKKFINCEVLNSYYVTKDGQNYWYEVILVDKSHPAIQKDERINWIGQPANRGRVFRGLTSAAKKSRGLRKKGKGSEKTRPSQAAHGNRL